MQIVCVHSYKGGAGKTTIATNLAVQLAQTHGKKVLLVESDFKMPSFYEMFKLHPQNYYNDYYNDKSISLIDCATPNTTVGNLDVVMANPEFDPTEKVHSFDRRWHNVHLRRLQQSLVDFRDEGRYHYVLFDTPPGFSFVAINNIALAHHGIVVVRPNSHAIEGTRRMVEKFYLKTKSPDKIRLYLLFNQIPRVPMGAELDQWTKEFDALHLTPSGRIPCSCSGTYAMAKGQHIFGTDHELVKFLQPQLALLLGQKSKLVDPTAQFTDVEELL